MTKFHFPLLLISFFIQTVVFGQEAPQEQKVVITKIAATWCPPCGGTAWDNFEVINDNYAGKAIILTAHPSRSSRLHAPEAIDFSNNLPQAFGQPLFYLNQTKYTTNNIITSAENVVNDATSENPLANTGLTATIKENEIEVNAKVKFFQEGTGDYHLSLLVIEDGVLEFQQSRGNPATHKRVLRSSLGQGTFGEAIASGTVLKDSEFSLKLTKELDPQWVAENIEIAAILWDKVDGRYEFVNANVVPVSFSTSVNVLEASGLSLVVAPTLVQQSTTITVDTPIAFDKINIAIFNAAGQQVQTLYTGSLNSGSHNFMLNKSNLTGRGFYFLQIESADSVISRKFVVE